MKRIMVAVACAALVLGGCVSTSTTMLAGGPPMAATDPASVTIYRTAEQVPGPYREIALLNFGGRRQFDQSHADVQFHAE